MAFKPLQAIWEAHRLASTVENAARDLKSVVDGLKALRDSFDALEKRVDRLEQREELLVEKTRTAASAAAMGMVADLSRRIGALEERTSGLKRLE